MRRFVFWLVLLSVCATSFGADAETNSKTMVSLDNDLIAFMKIAVWIGGVFLSIFALIGIIFFGWDVHKARNTIAEAEKDITQQVDRLRKYTGQWDELNEKFEQLGAQVQELIEASQSVTKANPQPSLTAADPNRESARSSVDLIREVISSSNYDWTTIGRIAKKTGLSRDEILREIRSSAPDIEISFGRKSQDHIFRFKNTR